MYLHQGTYATARASIPAEPLRDRPPDLVTVESTVRDIIRRKWDADF